MASNQRNTGYPWTFSKALKTHSRGMFYGEPDSTNTVVIVIDSFVQRASSNDGDLSGTIYNTAGATGITLTSVEYSLTGIGSWASVTVLDSDPLYSLPDGDAGGDPFNIPITMPDPGASSIYFRMIISWNSQQDVGGPFAFSFYQPTMKITPDLGWASKTDMLDSSKNPFMLEYTLTTLTQVGWSSGRTKTRGQLVITYSGTNYLLPDGALDRLGAPGRHYWQVGDSDIDYFILDLASPSAAAAPTPKARGVAILE
jgi:hypothetical protein